MTRRILAIAVKELLQFRRDWRTALALLGMPVVLLMIYGFALSFDVTDIRLGIVDLSRTSASRLVTDAFLKSGYFVQTAVIDDERTILAHLQAILEQEGYQVTVAGSGEEALEIAGELAPDLVVLDVRMPGVDTGALCAELKAAAADALARTATWVGNELDLDLRVAMVPVSAARAAGHDVLLADRSLIGRSGGMGRDGAVDPWSYFVNAYVLTKEGARLDRRNGQDTFVALYNHQIPPGAASVVHYRLEIPEHASGQLELHAALRYRKFNTE